MHWIFDYLKNLFVYRKEKKTNILYIKVEKYYKMTFFHRFFSHNNKFILTFMKNFFLISMKLKINHR